MKTLSIAGLLLLSTNAFAAPKHEVLSTKAAVSVHNLHCVIRAGGSTPVEGRTYTELSGMDAGTLPTVLNLKEKIELPQSSVTAEGCELAKLDKIVDDSLMFFGFKHDVPVEIVKDQAPSFINGNGQCVAVYNEAVTIDLGDGIVLKSEDGQLRAMSDCAKP